MVGINLRSFSQLKQFCEIAVKCLNCREVLTWRARTSPQRLGPNASELPNGFRGHPRLSLAWTDSDVRMSAQLESVPSVQYHTTSWAFDSWRCTAATSQTQEVQRFAALLRAKILITQPLEDDPQFTPRFSPPWFMGRKTKCAKDRTAPQVRAIFSSVSSSASSQLPWLLQDVGIFVMENLYIITTEPKAAYTGPQLNSAAGTEHILLTKFDHHSSTDH